MRSDEEPVRTTPPGVSATSRTESLSAPWALNRIDSSVQTPSAIVMVSPGRALAMAARSSADVVTSGRAAVGGAAALSTVASVTSVTKATSAETVRIIGRR